MKLTAIWLVLCLLSFGCAATDALFTPGPDGTMPVDAAGPIIDAGLSALGSPLGAAGAGGGLVGILGSLVTLFRDRAKNKRKRGEQWQAINGTAQQILELSAEYLYLVDTEMWLLSTRCVCFLEWANPSSCRRA